MNTTEIIVIMDRSGSMHAIRDDAVGAFNAFLTEQKALPDKARLTLVLFNEELETVYNSVDLAEVPELTNESYKPGGMTALHDAIGTTLTEVRDRLKDSPPRKMVIEGRTQQKVITAIITDGHENSSNSYGKSQIMELITEQKKFGWETLFLAANQDAIEEGAKFGIAKGQTMNFAPTSEGLREVGVHMSSAVASYRSSGGTGEAPNAAGSNAAGSITTSGGSLGDID